jgi:hypothetical protein
MILGIVVVCWWGALGVGIGWLILQIFSGHWLFWCINQDQAHLIGQALWLFWSWDWSADCILPGVLPECNPWKH